jgi:ribosomal protein L14E/L6E/L27E
MKKKILIDRIEKCISVGNAFKKARYVDKNDASENTLFTKWFSQTTACLIGIFGENHPYTKNFENTCSMQSMPQVDGGIGILTAAKEDIEDGYLNGLFGIISAEIFSDFLDMAEHLLQEKYKDPAAIIVGISLEAHLKGLSKKAEIETSNIDENGNIKHKKAGVINSDLCKAGVYNKLEEKMITAWLDLRNKAAHGQFSEYTIEQVNNMYLSVTDFITRTS